MAASRTPRDTGNIAKLDTKKYLDKFKRTGELADRALSRYGEPTMSLEELRAALDRELPPGFSLTEFVLREREAAW
ncbi:MAG: hypothetical protein FI707_09235 [SAR202 cluster bacterium]|jgi:hypothetical protein|nr:hypothetical protein [Chloroflexota bacterium]MDP6420255.1 hypothetical protein [SAR202 cluster bacterium]HAL47777.1 hypothetical protein [Dehalococcoidia bacterium]MDP6664970.1 hypothetical protein [SAR202 cluster bacterium]MDP6798651.1 hypothetical protein [SAR202 cluster bacterium]|tara:strand:- start:11038 stop:11265 length:228 start_codon:yes stop_codon:yes gene_type:complete